MIGNKEEIIAWLKDQDDSWTFEIERKFAGKSLKQNAYFHKMVDTYRRALGVSFAHCKNTMVTRYGQIEYIGDQPVVIKTNIPVEQIMEQELLHCEAVKVETQGDTEVIFYKVYRNIKTYNSQEMNELIEGTREELRRAGLEYRTPQEIAQDHMLEERNVR